MRRVRGFSAIAVLLGLLVATPAAAQQWSFEDAGVPIAYVDNGPAQFQFACRGGDLAMGYWVRVPHKTVAGAAAMSLAIMPDPGTGAGLAPNASFAQELPLIHSDGSSVIVRGPVARQWARIAQRACSRIRLAMCAAPPRAGLRRSTAIPSTPRAPRRRSRACSTAAAEPSGESRAPSTMRPDKVPPDDRGGLQPWR